MRESGLTLPNREVGRKVDEAEREARRRRRETWMAGHLARRTTVVADLAARAEDVPGWLAVRRHSGSYLRHLATWQRSSWYTNISHVLADHEAELRAWQARSDGELAAVAPEERAAAEAGLGLRLALIGKGGAGKTVLSSTLARVLARRGRRVLAVDLDVNPGMSYSVGLLGRDITLPTEALEEDPNAAYGWQLRTGLLPRVAVEEFAVPGPDGVSVMSVGKIGGLDKMSAKRTVPAVCEILLGYGESGVDVIADLEAGPTTPFEHYHAFADDVAVVVGPAWRSAMTARRLLPMVGEGRRTTIIANRFRDEPDHPGMAPHIRVPFDPEVWAAERRGESPLDAVPDSPTVAAVERIADWFTGTPVAPRT